MGSVCGSDGRAVASDARGPRFESSHRRNFMNLMFSVNCWKDENKDKQRPGMAIFYNHISPDCSMCTAFYFNCWSNDKIIHLSFPSIYCARPCSLISIIGLILKTHFQHKIKLRSFLSILIGCSKIMSTNKSALNEHSINVHLNIVNRLSSWSNEFDFRFSWYNLFGWLIGRSNSSQLSMSMDNHFYLEKLNAKIHS